MAQNRICSNIDYPPTFGNVAAFNLSRSVFDASPIAFQPEETYVQQTLGYASVQPLYKAIAAYADTELNITVTNRGEAHITVCAQLASCIFARWSHVHACCMQGLYDSVASGCASQVLTPPEFAVLEPFMTIDEINAIAGPLVQVQPLCKAVLPVKEISD